jgi:transcriptional regulator with XRE-family HTH domain
MGRDPSITLPESQVMLHCATKAILYPIDMTIGKRIKLARKRLQPKVTQKHIANAFQITDQAVSAWEREDNNGPENWRIPRLARLLKVPIAWLLDGEGDPPPPDGLDALLDDLSPAEREAVITVISAMRGRAGKVA